MLVRPARFGGTVIGTVRKSVLCTATVAALVAGLAAPAAAVTFTDKPTFTFLTAKQAPKDATYPKWTQSKVIKGLKGIEERPCGVQVLVGSKTEFRALYGLYKHDGYDVEYSISQYGLRASSEAAAKKLVQKIAACYPAKKQPNRPAVPQYGTYKVKSGLTAGVSQDCDGPRKNRNAMQWAYGRDKRDVMFMNFYTRYGTCNPSKTRWVDLTKKALGQF